MKRIFTLFLIAASLCMQGFAQESENASQQSSGAAEALGLDANGHEYVDLGLPSGTLWATMNVGAVKPAGYGDYVAWGETSGSNDGKETFSWKNYKWCKGSATSITKYKVDRKFAKEIQLLSDSELKNVSGVQVELELEDDAAHVNWGGDWRTPSVEQYTELLKNCDREWTVQNKRMGWMFTSKTNGNSIFFPAGGYREKTVYNLGNYGYYWTRNLHIRSSGGAYVFYFDQGTTNPNENYYRMHGRCVRAVLEKK